MLTLLHFRLFGVDKAVLNYKQIEISNVLTIWYGSSQKPAEYPHITFCNVTFFEQNEIEQDKWRIEMYIYLISGKMLSYIIFSGNFYINMAGRGEYLNL